MTPVLRTKRYLVKYSKFKQTQTATISSLLKQYKIMNFIIYLQLKAEFLNTAYLKL